jgi:hypothetical protein
MQLKIRRAGAVALVACCAAPAAALGAAQLNVKVSPLRAGTTAGPLSQAVSFDVSGLGKPGGALGNPTTATTDVRMMPSPAFTSRFGSFGSCSAALIVRGPATPKCPANAVVGTFGYTMWIPAYQLHVTTDYGYIYKTGAATFKAWAHSDALNTPDGGVTLGTLTGGQSKVRAVADFNFGPLADGTSAGTVVDLQEVHAEFVPNAKVKVAPSPNARCIERAKKIKNAKKRRTALRHCGAAHKTNVSHSVLGRAASVAASVFASTACAGGSWAFATQLSYSDHTSETPRASVACGGTAAAGATRASSVTSRGLF